MKRFFLIIAVLYAMPSFGLQVSDKKLSKKKLIEQADYYFFKEDFSRALSLYTQILENYPKNHYVQYHAFVAYHLSTGRGTDMTALKEYEANEGITDKFYNYWLGRIHYSRYDFDIAEEHFQAFLDMDIYRTNEIRKESENLLKQAQIAKEFHARPNDFEIEPMGEPVNSAYSDVSPAFYSDHEELLFLSSRPSQYDTSRYQVFHSYKTSGTFSQPKAIVNLGSFEARHAKIEVVNNDGRLFIYKDENGGNLYYAEQQSTGWSYPVEFNTQLNDDRQESNFYINATEDLIYFSAPASNKKLELYQSTYDPTTDAWSTAVPVPRLINSKYNEDHPFLSSDGKTLYFSSDRAESIGGYDVFKSEMDPSTGSWGVPTNLGFPTNTIDDEIGFKLNEDNISGFLSSNRLHGQGDFDIYYFHKQGKVLATGKVYNQDTNELMPQASINFHPVKYQDESFHTVVDNFGSYEIEIFEEEGFVVEIFMDETRLTTTRVTSNHEEHTKVFEQNFYVSLPDQIEQKTDFATLYQGKHTTKQSYEKIEMLGSKFRSGEKAILNNIYFDLHSVNFKQESYVALQKIREIMIENPDLAVEIGGHTCNIGSHEVNIEISLARAQSVKDYLTDQGISPRRLATKGYGETQPMASNDDEVNGRELNRRIEIRVIQ
ncbi:MAG: OmpA family protein [Reichenbachiella sp.]|uniref:OmpA family protein n=1 Tax=Reichenbachiella sp. TaxID=2184521 RepID=UPI00326469CD